MDGVEWVGVEWDGVEWVGVEWDGVVVDRNVVGLVVKAVDTILCSMDEADEDTSWSFVFNRF
jgi:hypothetical protein